MPGTFSLQAEEIPDLPAQVQGGRVSTATAAVAHAWVAAALFIRSCAAVAALIPDYLSLLDTN